jgi:hypothetical protein
MIASLTIAIIAIVGLPTSPAHAHSRSSAIYYGCGSNYNVVNDGIRTITWGGEVWGEVILTYNPSTGRNCVVTRKIKYHDVKTYTDARLQLQNDSNVYIDGGYYYHWAAVSRPASGVCVAYWGTVSTRKSPSEERYISAGNGRSTFGNCG